jgi:uncharacterized membrane protein YbhN (UPF0104 family)
VLRRDIPHAALTVPASPGADLPGRAGEAGGCSECFGRDVFAGAPPDATVAPPVLRTGTEGSVRRFAAEHRRALLGLLAAGGLSVLVLAVAPQVTGLGDTLSRVGRGDKAWLGLGIALEALSLAGYVAVFETVFSAHGTRIGWRASYQITMAGFVASKLFAAAGAGGVVLMAWALRAAGLDGRTVARRIAGFQIILYVVYMAALVVFGLGLGLGLLADGAPWSVTLLPAAFGAAVIALAVTFRFGPGRIERRLERPAGGSRRASRMLGRLALVPRTIREGIVTATDVLRRPRPALLGVLAYWAFDIATLWAAFRAFDAAPPVAVVVLGYYVGLLANTIPLPGGVGGVEGGMIAAFLALGVDGAGAVLAVLSYRALSFWLPTLPGAIAYFQLRRTIAGWRAGEDGPQSLVRTPG